MKPTHTIGIFHYQLGMTDGVSLEVEKWKTVLERMGHRVLLCAGRFGKNEGILLPELFHHRSEIELIHQNIFGGASSLSAQALDRLIFSHKRSLKEALRNVIVQNGMDYLLVNNIWSVAMNIPVAIALEEIRQEFGIRAVAHHHDFYWEKKTKPDPGNSVVEHILETYLPPQDQKIKHVVINSLAQSSLAEYKGIQSTVVPNVFDFDGPEWGVDAYNRDLRQAIGLKAGDICILQATRIVPRKGIELAVDLVEVLNAPQRRAKLQARGLYNGEIFSSDSKIVLVLAGYDRDDPTGTYLERLKLRAMEAGVDLRHIDSLIGSARSREKGSKIYSLWDSYTIADLVSYPSLWEGWGNQLLEAVRAKLPVVLFEYPVYSADIKEMNFNVISLGSEVISRDQQDLAKISDKMLQAAADRCVDYLTDKTLREKVVRRNYRIAKRHYSYDRLQDQLAKIF
jgi:glycosyltransferase involved in cell wall biosynthesis